MATKIVTKNSSTAGSAPSASDLVQGELAVNVADKRLYTEDNAGNIVELGTNPLGEITANGGIALGDSDKATFGASDDLQIYHDGSDSYIDDAGQGSLAIRGSASVSLQNYAGGVMLKGNAGSDTVLYHNGSTKLATTATGIDVTGTATMDGLTVDGNAIVQTTQPIFILKETDVTDQNTRLRNTAGDLQIQTINDAFTVASNRLTLDHATGDISFYEDTGTTPKLFWDASEEKLNLSGAGGIDVTGTATMDGLTVSGDILVNRTSAFTNAALEIQDGGNGEILALNNNSTDGQFLRLYNSGTLVGGLGNSVSDLNIYRGATAAININNSTGDISFYEDTGTTPKFFWDASAEALGIGTSSPAELLHLSDTTPVFRMEGASRTYQQYVSGTDFIIRDVSAGLNRVTLDSSGRVGIGTSSPSSALHAKGGSITTPANASAFLANATARLVVNHGNEYGAYVGYLNSTNDAIGIQSARTTGQTGPLSLNPYGGSVGIGTSSPSAYNAAGNSLVIANDAAGMTLASSPTGSGHILFADSTSGTGAYAGFIRYDHTTNSMRFAAGSGTERMRIDSSGNVQVGFSSYSSLGSVNTGCRLSNDGETNALARGSNGTILSFYSGNGGAGHISVTSNSAAYNTSSDQRLKENIADADDAGSKIDAIQVRKYDWKADGSHQDYGMIAQELQAVAPEAVSVPEDSEEMMGVDYSKLVPMLIKEIQSLRQRVASLEE